MKMHLSKVITLKGSGSVVTVLYLSQRIVVVLWS